MEHLRRLALADERGALGRGRDDPGQHEIVGPDGGKLRRLRRPPRRREKRSRGHRRSTMDYVVVKRRGPGGERPTVYGALDLGTNNCRLLVARPSRRGFLVIDAFSRIIRLGEGV